MGESTGLHSDSAARRVVVALGCLFVALALGWVLRGVPESASLGNAIVEAVLIGGPGFLLLAYAGWRLPRTDIRADAYPTIARWCLAGIGVMLAVVSVIELLPDSDLNRPLFAVLLATALGSVGGLGVGVQDARAKTRAREAERHSRELQRQNERLESFAGMLAHELRNPLNIAQIYHRQERPRNEEAAENVESALDRIEEMIDVLLVTARGPDANVDDEPVALADAAADAWTDVSDRPKEGEATSSRESMDLVVETEQTIRADPVHVEHLLRNLFRNSREHGDGDVTVRIGDLPGGFYVEDDGPGIPEDVREEVVEAGFTTKTDGIGLGLTFVAQLAEMYDWHCEIVESEAGGARFEFTGVEFAAVEEGRQRQKTN